ncbi:MAG: diguanylate cyclase [Eubacteriales bacterium]
MQEQVSSLNQYLEAAQSISGESLFYVNMKTRILRQKGPVAIELGVPEEIPNYPEGAYPFVWAEDLANYMEFAKNTLAGEDSSVEVRVKTATGEYQWYEIISMMIFDEFGIKKEVFGRMTNIQQSKAMETEVSLLTQYFDTMQSLSDESIYVYDLETKLLHLGGLTETELGLPLILEGYPDTFYPYTHPEDLENFKAFARRSLNTYESRLELRLKNIDGTYKLYELVSNVIYGENGAPSKILGKVRNIQSKYQLEAEIQETNQFLEIMQELSDDILYRIDLETMTLHFTLKTESGSIITKTYDNYPNSAIFHDLVHPDDIASIEQQTQEFLAGTMKRIQIRLKLTSDEYIWYLDTALEISDAQGKHKKIYGSLKNIHKEVMAVQKQKEEYQHFTAMQDLSDDIFFRVDNHLTLYHNVESKHKIIQSKEIPNYPAAFVNENIIHPEDVEKYKEERKNFESGDSFDGNYRFALFDETYLWYTVKARKIYDDNGQTSEVIGRLINMQKEYDMQSDYSALNQYFTAMQDLSDDILFHIDIHTMTFHHNDKNANNLGLSYDIPDFVNTLIDKKIIHPDCHGTYRKDIDDMLSARKMEYHVLSLAKPNVYEWFYVQGSFIRNEKGEPIEIFGKMQNIQAQRNLEQRAYHDMMTGALNKATFEEEAKKVLERFQSGEKHALVFIDLDDFKSVNDTLGHSYGDALLTTVGKRLKRLVRGDDLVGRIGGDEFTVMLRSIDSEESVLVRTNLMLESLRRDFSFEKKVIGIKASVGVSLYPNHGTTYKDLIGKADIAVYESKRRGKNVVSLYAEALEEY